MTGSFTDMRIFDSASFFAALTRGGLCLGWFALASRLVAADAKFIRAVNLNGPALEIDGRRWEGRESTNLVVNGKLFENQAVPLKPATDPNRARMIRSSVWGSSVDVELNGFSPGDYQILLYVWEDNHSERFDLLVNDRSVLEGLYSGSAGAWRKLGPWKAPAREGRLKISARAASHGAVNLSGVEIWSGDGEIPAATSMSFVTQPSPEQTEFFERRIRPVLVEQCYECHSTTAKKIKGGLVLDSRAGVIRGGDNGPAITPGQPEASLLIQAIRRTDPELVMPPDTKLSPAAIADLEAWVLMGAPDPRTEIASTSAAQGAINWTKAREWWSFRPLKQPTPPRVKQIAWPANELDRFILAGLEQDGLTPVEDAEKRVWIRRATFDLTGLPPTPGEVDSFVADVSPAAYAKVVDRLLSSPHYGERWGRYWLDVVRYADTAGDNSDFPIPQIYRYRDWVVSAFNRDLPYDEFIRQQIAGDLIPGTTPEARLTQLIATGYLANARRFGSRVDDYPQHLTIEDTIDNLGRAFLGLTINCARCHDHKFDPITSADYYALYGIFNSTRYPWPGIELEQKQRDFVPLVTADKSSEAEATLRNREAEQRRLDKVVQQLKDSLKSAAENAKKEIETQIQVAEKAAKAHQAQALPFEMAYAVLEGTKIGDAAIQVKGDPAKPAGVVGRRFLTVLGGATLAPQSHQSGRRELAGWIADRDNPLTARVMVNRLWLHHFGKGLVPTPNDFGRQGKPPTHPELLDWLAARFIDSGWSVKTMHRLIMLSRTYGLASRTSEDAVTRDIGNERLSSYPRRRLDAEAIRDTMLVLADNLDTSSAGGHPFPPMSEWKFTQHNPFKAVYDSRRRSLYLMTQRIQRHPYLAIFDGADPAASTPLRPTSTTPLQALYLLNDGFVHEQSRRFAERIACLPNDDSARLEAAYRLALGRPADSMELEGAKRFLSNVRGKYRAGGTPEDQVDAAAWQAMSRVLFRLNEFVYLD